MQAHTWLQIFLKREQLHLLVDLLLILGSAEVDLEGGEVRVISDYDNLSSEQIGRAVELQHEHHFTLAIGNR